MVHRYTCNDHSTCKVDKGLIGGCIGNYESRILFIVRRNFDRETELSSNISVSVLMISIKDNQCLSITPMVHSYRLGFVTGGYQVRIPVRPDICHRGCAYTGLQTVQLCTVLPMVLCTIKKPFEIRVGHRTGFWLPSVAMLPCLCRKRRKARLTL